MDAAELDRRSRTYDGWIPPWVVSLLVEHGHLEEVRVQAGRGDWYCARRVAELLIEEGRREDGLEVLRSFVDSGWWGAADVVAGLLDEWGRTDEAVALVRPYAEDGERLAVHRLAQLLAGQGRVDEVITLLGPHTDDWFLAEALVQLTEGYGRDAEVLALLPGVGAGLECSGRCQDEVGTAGLRARVLERQGRVDEAVTLLSAFAWRGNVVHVNLVKQVADVLARHGRETELRELVAGRGDDHAAYRLAALLEKRGLVDEAVDALRPFVTRGSPNAAWTTADLLKRHGRVDEAIEVLLPVPAVMGGDLDWIVHELWTLLADQGRADQALAAIDDIAGQVGGMSEELFLQRIRLLAYCGRHEQAIDELRAHPEADAWYMVSELADLLADAGRLDEAVAVMEPVCRATGSHHNSLAQLMIRQGRAKEAVALLSERRAVAGPRNPWGAVDASGYSADPPF
ncbi:tetratricopeptide repeat protein [Streptomyces sp. CA-251387]|uniref:tetratricopeptide repeat protein n=1 Tax=Streptomyces sp. CA-251387 TaxID=3240064 RepID=UPI003D8C3A7A